MVRIIVDYFTRAKSNKTVSKWNEQRKMVKSLSLLKKGSQTTQRILAGVLFLVFCIILGNFPGLYAAQAQLQEGTPDEGPILQLIHQKIFKENVVHRFSPEKIEKESFSLFEIIKYKKNKFRKPVLDKEKFKIKISSFLIHKDFCLKSTANTTVSYHVKYLTLPLQGRDPPYISQKTLTEK